MVAMPSEAVSVWRASSSCFFQLLLCSVLLSIDARAIDLQGEALLSWKRSLNGDSSNDDVLADWNPNDASPCRWYGITCDASGRVVELTLQYVDLLGGVPANLSALASSLSKLVLSGTNLSGPIPPQLGELPRLVHLDLSDNALMGSIPDGLCRPGSRLERLYLNSNRLEGPIPPSIGNLSLLRWLVVYDNQLEGEIPPTIGQLARLEVFRAGGNKNLRGPLPPEIGNCTSLVIIGLAETGISGPLPASMGGLRNLQTLAIYTALLSGPIPPELGQCAELQNMYLYENSLSGSIPPQLGQLKKLRNLLLWQNNLVGVIPPELGDCGELQVVDLSMNGLTGRIPATLGNITDLRELQLSVNQISGPILPEIARCRNLSDLELDNNLISGGIPAEIGLLVKLRTLYLWANRLTGGIPPEMGGCENLEAVDLSQNNLTGSIPKGIFRLRSLSKLLLLDNDLSGAIPPEVGNCSSLVRFRANGNGITGAIPPEIGLLKNLSFLDLSSNRLTGAIPGAMAGCRNLSFVDLHDNNIGGSLPDGLFEGLVSPQYIDLSDNSIGGDLPPAIGSLTSLTKLILARNQFSGQIPPAIGSCSRLQLLDLSNNGLSGEIPAIIGKIMALEIAVNLSYNDLSGQIPAEFAALIRLGVLDLSHNRLSGDLQPLAALENLVALNVSFNNFSGRVPDSVFFSKLPIGDLEGNPSLCLARCSGFDDVSDRINARRAGRVATAVLLSVAVVLFATAAIALVSRRRAHREDGCDDAEKDGDLSPPWDVTLYQKMEIGVVDVARRLTASNVIGRGWSGVVYRVRIPSTGALIAVKKFRTGDEAAAAAFACEIGALARVRHRKIVRLLGWAANRRSQLLFYDYLPSGTLGGLLHGGGAVAAVEWEMRLGIAVGVAEGLAYLHHDCAPAIIHGDVKTENVLLGERYEACLADFGLARVVDDGGADRRDSHTPGFAGSYGYIAPEHGCMTRITTKSDVYSFGVVLLETITGRRPADPAFGEGQSVVQWVQDHLRRKRDPAEVVDPRLQGRADPQVQEMLQALGIALLCTSTRPDDRPTMKDVAALLRGIHGHDDPSNPAEARKPGSVSVGDGEVRKRDEPSEAAIRTPSQCSLAFSSSSSRSIDNCLQ
ncbi:Leucine rich repeat N-terminal domain [Musa troglodytarum]|uniref:Leucine rich repeat N-terminal domain n=1 Tax=Musa troglodytarum TaxID=320322 RepID=A0A9E7JBC5_9LILI|nr:Leucine rich repeat N-terminal domain [Musa troglodytarum]